MAIWSSCMATNASPGRKPDILVQTGTIKCTRREDCNTDGAEDEEEGVVVRQVCVGSGWVEMDRKFEFGGVRVRLAQACLRLSSPPHPQPTSALRHHLRRRPRRRSRVSRIAMSSAASSPVIQRIVPGAPPPAPVSKSQKKKKKAAKEGDVHVEIPDAATAAQIETAPSQEDTKDGSVAPQLLAQPSEIPEATTPVGDGAHKTTPLIDMLNKRIKATNKKIVCYNILCSIIYSSSTAYFLDCSCVFRATPQALWRNSMMTRNAP